MCFLRYDVRMERKMKDGKIQVNTTLDAELVKEFKIYCIQTDNPMNYYIEQMMREKLGK